MPDKALNLLLVEDNPADAYLLKELLAEKAKHIEMRFVRDGHEALDYVFRRNKHPNAPRPDLILLDLGLPRISGYEVLTELKHHTHVANIPVIILTTSRNPLDQSQCEKLGASRFLSKPHNLAGYDQLIEQLTRNIVPELMAS